MNRRECNSVEDKRGIFFPFVFFSSARLPRARPGRPRQRQRPGHRSCRGGRSRSPGSPAEPRHRSDASTPSPAPRDSTLSSPSTPASIRSPPARRALRASPRTKSRSTSIRSPKSTSPCRSALYRRRSPSPQGVELVEPSNSTVGPLIESADHRPGPVAVPQRLRSHPVECGRDSGQRLAQLERFDAVGSEYFGRAPGSRRLR